MREIYSIEPLSESQIRLIQESTGDAVTILPRNLDVNLDVFSKAEVLIARDRDEISKILNICPNLRFLFIVSTGVEKLPFNELYERDILVANTGGVNSEIMSEYALAYILADSARVKENLTNQKLHHWKKYQCVDSLVGKTVLIVGSGRVGSLIAQKTRCFGMKNFGIKRKVEELPFFEKVVGLDNLYDMLPIADYVICSLPLTSMTKNIFNIDAFKKMKSTAMFINISRGGCVDINGLTESLTKNKIRKAVLDVFDKEPLTTDSPLWDVPNLLITPHSSGRLENFMEEAMKCFVNNYTSYKSKKELPNKVDLINGY